MTASAPASQQLGETVASSLKGTLTYADGGITSGSILTAYHEAEAALAELVTLAERAEAAEAALTERDANAGLCGTCGEWYGIGHGCEECSEFMQESGHNARNNEYLDAAESRSAALEAQLAETTVIVKVAHDVIIKAPPEVQKEFLEGIARGVAALAEASS